MPQFSVNINGEQKSIDAPEDMPLLWVIRDLLGMKGTKFGCGKALCGACTVHLDGQAIRSCSMAISDLGDAKITTIEGLSENGDHPIQKAWVEHIVPQCGYCQSGQIMNAASLLNQNSSPSDEEIEQSMSGNLCRCGTYNRIKEAIKTASKS
ncbi:(2Fe-2S)-binding protein [Algoriphagus zhangzhouensis]|uniref:Isoquinoline 1-oxidoreductase, alpha subunit n=1 Tax=Algoriphagus zhangzhouensis TaxID=1073327 RepID=A0A1M7ZDY8_9BACT|nr:(2Fe-2S)-binding protein [Algoriphagus zhangzhouensis]TDY45868.1 isoquinoline 1-oxidoreductase alpha subunit [Algoriphagus zhangzhouensis]SHO63019.1 isoquinoline 1-oxidoreductase, alpha subunit [Algoriphagus zhangzhouensis]